MSNHTSTMSSHTSENDISTNEHLSENAPTETHPAVKNRCLALGLPVRPQLPRLLPAPEPLGPGRRRRRPRALRERRLDKHALQAKQFLQTIQNSVRQKFSRTEIQPDNYIQLKKTSFIFSLS